MPFSYLHQYSNLPENIQVAFYAGSADLSSHVLPEEVRAFGQPAFLKQIHSNTVVNVASHGHQGEGDALVTEQAGIALCIQTADCVPVLLWRANRIAAIHAGWRGLEQRIITRCIEVFGVPDGALVGPCISASHYETGDPVLEALVSAGFPDDVIRRKGADKDHCDLRAAAVYELGLSGCTDIQHHARCTFSTSELPSYRRSGPGAGRLLSIIALKK